jgi:hypothetical protein
LKEVVFQLKKERAGHQWLTPAILATQEAEIRRIADRSQPRQVVCKALHKKRVARVAQGVGPEFKPQYHKKKKRKSDNSTCLASIRPLIQTTVTHPPPKKHIFKEERGKKRKPCTVVQPCSPGCLGD